ncbi:hypothetical protein FXV77_19745 [Sphingobacterium phlebotomi]|uniref:Uncharacterized protein n=1 Tax=Sphingobacterium phlebotomi TaxID=2605433 RepID=A0A5D4GWB3_9SPHI|nr:hypothetical protein [Sphingobacterium phlebotomi]TYR32233.1 hypothetical protein FXV77_19745 [Sphingobacterium phlebotomi]
MGKRFIIVMYCILGIAIVFHSCKKDDDDKDEVEERQIVDWGDVYFIGFSLENNTGIPSYYRNNKAFPLELGTGVQVNPADITVASGNVYVIGTENRDQPGSDHVTKAVLWKNGKRSELRTPETTYEEATAVFVSGEDVYVTGSYFLADGEKRIGVVWKNGDILMATDGKESTTFADIFVSGDDVYTVGHENTQGGIVSKYWKNGKAVTLSTADITTYAKSIVVDGADIYVLGYVDNLSTVGRSLTLWKNGKADKLISGRSVIRGGKVVIENGDVYACGYEQVGSKYEPRFFKNGVKQPLDDYNNGHTYAIDLQISEGNALVLGNMDSELSRKSILWVNGGIVNLHGLENEVDMIAFDIATF